jgi:hypothetical protein
MILKWNPKIYVLDIYSFEKNRFKSNFIIPRDYKKVWSILKLFTIMKNGKIRDIDFLYQGRLIKPSFNMANRGTWHSSCKSGRSRRACRCKVQGAVGVM